MAELKKIEDGKVEITAVVEGETWETAQSKAFNKLARNIEIKGFRKGQAPKNMVMQRLSEGTILAQAAEDIANDTFKAALDETKVELIDRASLDIKSIDLNHVEFVFSCPVKPDVTLGEYKNLGYAPKEAVVEEEEVQKQINMIVDQKADLELKEDGTVEDGDVVVIDYEGFKEGVAFEGGRDENYSLTIGSHTFIPGFEEALIGMKAEEERDIDLTFPEDYHAEELKGQAVVFKVKVHEIKHKVLPELNEELIKELGIENVNNLDELKKHIYDTLLERKKRQYEDEAMNALLDKVCENATVNIPEVMIEDETNQMMRETDQEMQSQGFSLDQYIKMMGLDIAKFKENLRIDATNRTKLRLVLEEVAKVENVEVTDEDVKCEIEDLANKYGIKYEDIEKMVDKNAIKNDLKMRKALDIVKA